MNTRQVIESVANLSARDAADADVLICFVNRALDEVGRRFPITAKEKIAHALPIPIYASCERVTVEPHRPLRISPEKIASFSLSVYGEGVLSVFLDGAHMKDYPVTQKEGLILALKVADLLDGCLQGAVELVFAAKSKLYLESVAFFKEAPEVVPQYRRLYPYMASDFRHRFLSFSKKVMKNGVDHTKNGLLRFEDGQVLIPYEADGIYEIEYKALPDLLKNETDEITLREDLWSAVILLAAYYAALEDENPNADAFLSRYEKAIDALMPIEDETVGNVYGW